MQESREGQVLLRAALLPEEGDRSLARPSHTDWQWVNFRPSVLSPLSPLTPQLARTKTQKACSFPQPPTQFHLSTRKKSSPETRHAATTQRGLDSLGRVGTEPEGSQPKWSWQERGQGKGYLLDSTRTTFGWINSQE